MVVGLTCVNSNPRRLATAGFMFSNDGFITALPVMLISDAPAALASARALRQLGTALEELDARDRCARPRGRGGADCDGCRIRERGARGWIGQRDDRLAVVCHDQAEKQPDADYGLAARHAPSRNGICHMTASLSREGGRKRKMLQTPGRLCSKNKASRIQIREMFECGIPRKKGEETP